MSVPSFDTRSGSLIDRALFNHRAVVVLSGHAVAAQCQL